MSFEFFIQSIAEGFLVAFIIYGLIFEKRLIRFERKAYVFAKACFKSIKAGIKSRVKNLKYRRKIRNISIYKN